MVGRQLASWCGARRRAVAVTGSGGSGGSVRPALTVALITAVVAEVMRVSFPLLYDLAGRIGFTTAAWVVPLMFAAPLAVAPLGRWLSPRTLLLVSGLGLAVARVILQFQDRPTVAVAVAGTLLGLVALAAGLRAARAEVDGPPAALGLYLGLTADTAVRLALTTWDAAWQSTPLAMIIGTAGPALLAASVIATAVVSGAEADQRSPLDGTDSVASAALPGPVLALQTLVLANPGVVASSGGVTLPMAGSIVLVGFAVAAAMPAVSRGVPLWSARLAVVVVAAVSTGPTGLTGVAACVAVLVGQGATGLLLATAYARPRAVESDERSIRTWAGAGCACLLLVGVLLPYQISYELPLGLPQFVFPALGAVLLVALAAAASTAPSMPEAGPTSKEDRPVRSGRLARPIAVLAPIIALGVPMWSALTWPAATPTASGTASATASTTTSAPDGTHQVRVATYNIHSAVSWHGDLDPAGIAEVLDDGGAEVTMLQEVARGWPLAGGLDTAAWLSRRLGAEVVYGGAADHQFGNAVLSVHPISEHWSGVMDRGQGTMQRGYVAASVVLGDGVELDVWSTHLQHQDHTTETRQAQARQVLTARESSGRDVPALIGGDFNSRPGSADIEPWFDGTGLVSAQDVAGDPDLNTSPASDPDHRIDWILGTEDLAFSAVDIPSTLASDHLPVFATVVVAPE